MLSSICNHTEKEGIGGSFPTDSFIRTKKSFTTKSFYFTRRPGTRFLFSRFPQYNKPYINPPRKA